MPLLPNNDQLVPLSLGKLRLHFLTFLSLNPLALSRDHLALIWIGWQPWLRDCISVFLALLMSYTLPTTKFRFIYPPLRHNWMRFSISYRETFSYSCQKGGEHLLLWISLTIAYSNGESITWKEECILKGGDQWAQKKEANLQPLTLLDSLTMLFG